MVARSGLSLWRGSRDASPLPAKAVSTDKHRTSPSTLGAGGKATPNKDTASVSL